MPTLSLLCRFCTVVFLLLPGRPAGLSAVDPASVADSVDAVVESVVNRAASFPPLSLFPGDRASFTNLSYNRVDGLFLGIGSDRRHAMRFDPELLAHFNLGYSFGSHYWQVAGGVARRFGPREWATLVGVEGYHGTDTHDEWKIPDWENSLHAFFAREDYLSWFRRSGWNVYAEQYFRRDLSVVAMFGANRCEPLPRAVSWSLFGGDKVFSENISFGEAYIRTVSIALRYNGLPRLPRTGAGVRISLQAEQGRGDRSYERWLAEALWHQPLGNIATLNSRLRLGSATGDNFAPKLFAIGGTGTLPGYRLNEFGGNRMALWNTELFLHGTAFIRGRIGSSVSLIFSYDVGYTAQAAEHTALWDELSPQAFAQLKPSAGIALGSANGVLRLGAAWRTDRKETPSVVVRFSPFLR